MRVDTRRPHARHDVGMFAFWRPAVSGWNLDGICQEAAQEGVFATACQGLQCIDEGWGKYFGGPYFPQLPSPSPAPSMWGLRGPPAPPPPSPPSWASWFGCGTAWAVDVLGWATLGSRWDLIKAAITILVVLLATAVLLYGLDLLLRPFVWMAHTFNRVWRRWRKLLEAGPPPNRCDEMDWRGPGTREPADNDFYRDVIRARSAGRKQHHILINDGGRTARLERAPGKMPPPSRFGQKFPYTDVFSCNGRELRCKLEDVPDSERLVHLCRDSPCGETQPVALHVCMYTGVGSDARLDLYGTQWYSPLSLCCSWMTGSLGQFKRGRV